VSTEELWVLGATGRTGRDVAARLTGAGLPVTLVGRDAARLARAAADLPGEPRTLVAEDVGAIAAAIRREQPAVVVNTVGPFARTARPLAEACLPAGGYVDLANDVVAAEALLALHDDAERAGSTLVTGAGFGLLATEAPLVALLRGRPAPRAVRVDSIPSIAFEAGVLGEALAATIIEGLPEGGRTVRGGRLVRAGVGGHAARVALPDGSVVTTGSWPSGDLVAAARTSGASEVVAATTEVPTGTAIRAVVPVAGPLLRIPPLRRFATARLAVRRLEGGPRPREHSWARARAEWADGRVEEAWLRTGDAGVFTAAAAAAVAIRIARGDGVPGAHTPIAAVGWDVVAEAGGEIV
jgi:short subunit dehydrogenase-like uncharacterized protein